jgi:hypothetical protein
VESAVGLEVVEEKPASVHGGDVLKGIVLGAATLTEGLTIRLHPAN